MAFSGEAANNVWQRVEIALAALEANSFTRDQFRALKAYLSQIKRNPNLQFIAFTEAECDAAGGTVKLTGAATLYGVFVKKENEGTDNTFFLYDDATDDTTAANARVGLSLLTAKQETAAIYPQGMPLATGVVVTQYTVGIGATDGSNGGNGFVILAA